MSDLFGNHIVGFPTRWLKFTVIATTLVCTVMHKEVMPLENQQCGFRSGPIQSKLYEHRRWLEAGHFQFRKERNCKYLCSENEGTDQLGGKLICTFAFAYAKSWFSHDADQVIQTSILNE